MLDLSFLDSSNLSQEVKDSVKKVSSSRDLRILVFSQIQTIYTKAPKNLEEAASLFYEAKGLMSILSQTK